MKDYKASFREESLQARNSALRKASMGKREGLTVEQMVRFCIHDFIGQSDDVFHAAAKRVMEKNAELYRRLS